MEKKICYEHTRYAIYLKLYTPCTIQVGKLGTFDFAPGTYVYVGSAKKGIHSRIERHIRVEKPMRWHFDYLRPYGEITRIITYEASVGECELAEKLRQELHAITPVRKFGSSDCKCYSHLLYFQ